MRFTTWSSVAASALYKTLAEFICNQRGTSVQKCILENITPGEFSLRIMSPTCGLENCSELHTNTLLHHTPTP